MMRYPGIEANGQITNHPQTDPLRKEKGLGYRWGLFIHAVIHATSGDQDMRPMSNPGCVILR